MLENYEPTASVEEVESALLKGITSSMTSAKEVEPPKLTAVISNFESDSETKFEFDTDFQSKIAALTIRDTAFNTRTLGLISPSYFENAVEAKLVDIALNYFKTYKKSPDIVTLGKLVRDAIDRKLIRSDLIVEVKAKVSAIARADITDSVYAANEVAKFAKYSEMTNAVLASVDLLAVGKYDEIEKKVKTALAIGLQNENPEYDYFKEIESRTKIRRDTLAGLIKPNGITTGIKLLNEMLHHKGWGRKELHSLLGGAKVGKSTALAHFAKVAAFAGHNVIYFTLEMSPKIIGDRLDAAITGHSMKELGLNLNDINEQISAHYDSADIGALKIRDFPSGTMKPSHIRKILEEYKAEGMLFDMCVVDYADIMAPEQRNSDPIENSKNIYLDIRAIAQEYDLAMLTATQTNRTGFTAATSKAEHASEDFNKVRIVDLMISINRTEEEMEKNEARLYFAASRNQKGNFTIRIEQDLEKMRFLTKVLGVT